VSVAVSESRAEHSGESRKRRADAGVTRFTSRDVAAMVWLTNMRAIGERDLAVLLARLAGRAKPLGVHATRDVVDRWRRAGVADRRRVWVHTPPYIWLTFDGARLAAGVEHWNEPTWSVLPHLAAVSRARLLLEALPEFRGSEWVSEREWRRENDAAIKSGGVHVPDGELITPDGRRLAVEVELSDKGKTRTREIVEKIAVQWPDGLLYVVPEGQVARTVLAAVQTAQEDYQDAGGVPGQVWVLPLPPGPSQ
jgi:hypothetical protein